MIDQIKDRIYGTIYGQVIGDALGARYEFSSSFRVKQKIERDIQNNDNSENGFLDILGGGSFNVKPGQVTDDSELALGLLYSILENKGYNKEAVAEKYLDWIRSGPFDMGRTTKNALLCGRDYNDICNKSLKYNKESLSNGCLMRISPLGVYGIRLSDDDLLKYVKEDCSITNPHTVAVDAVSVFCIAIKTLVLTGDRLTAYGNALKIAKTDLIKRVLLGAKDSPFGASLLNTNNGLGGINSRAKTCETHDRICKGYLGIALKNAFYELLNGKSFYDSMINTIGRGGDTDTNGCITGALIGAYYGINRIPGKWIDSVNIYNPRSRKYKEVDQTKLPKIISEYIDMILSSQTK